MPPRREDVFRHLTDLREDAFEGVHERAGRVDLFRRAVELMDPLVTRILAETNEAFLLRSGDLGRTGVEEDGSGGHQASWTLSWPEQRAATSRFGGSVGPIQVWARFLGAFTHPHLSGEKAGNWPMQVTTAADVARQELVVRAIVEAELHERVFEGRWQIVPAFTRRD
jgi:hypothetical protein